MAAGRVWNHCAAGGLTLGRVYIDAEGFYRGTGWAVPVRASLGAARGRHVWGAVLGLSVPGVSGGRMSRSRPSHHNRDYATLRGETLIIGVAFALLRASVTGMHSGGESGEARIWTGRKWAMPDLSTVEQPTT